MRKMLSFALQKIQKAGGNNYLYFLGIHYYEKACACRHVRMLPNTHGSAERKELWTDFNLLTLEFQYL